MKNKNFIPPLCKELIDMIHKQNESLRQWYEVYEEMKITSNDDKFVREIQNEISSIKHTYDINTEIKRAEVVNCLLSYKCKHDDILESLKDYGEYALKFHIEYNLGIPIDRLGEI